MSILVNLKRHWYKLYLTWGFIGILAIITLQPEHNYSSSSQTTISEASLNTQYHVLRSLSSLNTANSDNNTVSDAGISCTKDRDCGNGMCSDDNICKCDENYTTLDSACDYKMRSQLAVWLLSFFVGGLGVDWFFLARGNACYNCAGVAKLLTGGGFGIWWIVDWIRILTGSFPDGNGVQLCMNMT
jgi:hypothetical protein